MGHKQAGVDDGHVAGVTTVEARRVRELEQENRELRRANEILKRAASFFGASCQRRNADSGVGDPLGGELPRLWGYFPMTS